MKKTFAILSVLLLTLLSGQANAQKTKSDSDYNLQRAWEALKEENDEQKAWDLVSKQLRETPDNVQALLLSARLNRKKGEYGAALADVNHALRVNKPKKSEVPMSTLHWWKGRIYQEMDELALSSESFAKAYALAKKDDKENLQSISFDYGCSLMLLDRLDEADVVFDAMLKEDETDAAAMVGKASTLIERGKNAEAIDILEKARKYYESYSEIYRFLMKAHRNLGQNNKAIDAAVSYFDKDDDPQVDSVLSVFAKNPNYASATLKAQAKKSDEPLQWTYLLGRFQEHIRDYAAAIRTYEALEKDFGKDDVLDYRQASCYSELGITDRAVALLDGLVEKDPDWMVYVIRGDVYRDAGRLEEAIRDYSAAIEEIPDGALAYTKRGWTYKMKGDKDKALEDYNLGIDNSQDYSFLYMLRGELLLENGDEEAARKDFEAILQIDTLAEDGSCRHYALHFLGKDREAEEWMDKIIALDPDSPGNNYDRACLYARMGRLEDALASLRTSFEKGYRGFGHIMHDDDMAPLRGLPEFEALMDEYRAKHEAYLKEYEFSTGEEGDKETTITEIAMTRKRGGTFEIPCDINGLALQMIFDTGASDVTISSVEANFMLKNGYLSEKDIKGKRYYQVANGQLSEGTVVTLREVKVGDAVLHNVDASVVNSQQAPLLLGQSAMERFGTITIDNINNKLIIKH